MLLPVLFNLNTNKIPQNKAKNSRLVFNTSYTYFNQPEKDIFVPGRTELAGNHRHSPDPARKHHSARRTADHRNVHGPDESATDYIRKAGVDCINSASAGSPCCHTLHHQDNRIQR